MTVMLVMAVVCSSGFTGQVADV